jgi:FkbM family methyltransferase
MSFESLKQYKGVWIRTDSPCDSKMVKECLVNYKHFTFDKNSRVLDFGGNIGTFGWMALKAGVLPENYMVYEPDPSNIAVLHKNTHASISVKQKVVTMSTDQILTFYKNTSGNAACSGTATPASERSKGHRKVRYDVVNDYLPDVIKFFKPTHLKMDIEGGEDAWLRQTYGVLPKHVKQFAMELHGVDTTMFFETECYDSLAKEWDFVHVGPNSGFDNENADVWAFPKLGFKGRGALFGVDLFLRRKS